MLGLFERTARFVKRYGDMAGYVSERVETYAQEVRSRAFPTPDQTYAPKS
jgi:3-methyl-2-oxobutanoate hydroxymethyltransferase